MNNKRVLVAYKLNKLIKEVTCKWVADNFGTQEAEDPSWNIEELSATITGAIMDKVYKKSVQEKCTRKENK